jgi:hypothetical protein
MIHLNNSLASSHLPIHHPATAFWKNKAYSPGYSTSETNLFSTSVEWYEDNMPARSGATDPIAQTYIDTWSFTTIEDGLRVGFSLYRVLEELCKAWRMRLIFSNGIYRFIQIQSYEGGTGTT